MDYRIIIKTIAQIIITTAAVITALGVITWSAWSFGDDIGYRPIIKKEFIGFINNEFQLAMDQTKQNTLALAKNQFDILWGKKEHGGLDYEERVSLCTSAKILEYKVIDQNGQPECAENGKPILKFKQ